MTGLLDALHEDHVNMMRLLEVFERQLTIFERADVPDYDVIGGVIEYCLAYPDLYHHPKEDLLIAELSARNSSSLVVVREIQEEHVELRELTRRLAAAIRHIRLGAELPRETFGALGREFLHLYRWHIEREERILFTVASDLLTPADWAILDRRITTPADPVFGQKPDRQFEALRNSIVVWDACR